VRSNIERLLSELKDARTLIDSIAPVNDALSGQLNNAIQTYLSVRRRFDYAALVVAIYASYEKFIEDIVAAYARVKAMGKPYSMLPPKLIEKHCRKSTEIVSKGFLGRGRYPGITEFTVIDNLYQCMSDSPNYRLNDIAIVAHESNLRYYETLTLIGNLGIDDLCNKVRHTESLTNWFKNTSASTGEVEGVPLETVLTRLEDLVERRNQITHRGGSPDSILGPQELRELVEFVEAVCQGIFEVIVRDYLELEYLATGRTSELTIKEDPIKDGTVVIIDNPRVKTCKGQPVFYIAGVSRIAVGRVKDIQINGTSYDFVDDLRFIELGIELDFKIPKSAMLYQLATEDELLWPVVER
jgi:hypothetical protein